MAEETPSKPAAPQQAASKPDAASLLARLEALEAKQAESDAEVVEENPTYAQVSDAADKSYYFEADAAGYEKAGLAGPDGGYGDLDKVNELYHKEDGAEEDEKVISYRVRHGEGQQVLSVVVDPGAQKKVIYLDKD